jgi:alkylation response protein AidB-like acyl-CoA dehydrogenase
MDLSFTAEERDFRTEMRRFFRTEIPAEIRERAGCGEHVSKQDLVTTQRAMNQAGIAVPHWPVAWGGKDWTSVQSYIWLDEMQLASVPAPLAFNTSMVGPVIAQFGSEAQKQRFLPPTANLDIWWCQGFS